MLTLPSKIVSGPLQICEKVVVPNLRTRPEDEEVFEMNPVEYIR